MSQIADLAKKITTLLGIVGTEPSPLQKCESEVMRLTAQLDVAERALQLHREELLRLQSDLDSVVEASNLLRSTNKNLTLILRQCADTFDALLQAPDAGAAFERSRADIADLKFRITDSLPARSEDAI